MQEWLRWLSAWPPVCIGEDKVAPPGRTAVIRLAIALEAEIQWYRQICSNGMIGWRGDPVRHIHRYGNVLGWLQDRLTRRFRELPGERYFFSQMMEKDVPLNIIRGWVDVLVARRWGREDAARVYHIATAAKAATFPISRNTLAFLSNRPSMLQS